MSVSRERLAARLSFIEQHVRLGNEHDLEGILA
jgi:hypothetical protein